MIEVFSSGGGTQSTCISALIVQGRLPKPDFMVIADTGRECSATWEYLENVVRPELARVGVEVCRIDPSWKSVPEHGRDWMSHNGETILVPAFTDEGGGDREGKLSGFCSKTWKVEVVNRYLSQVHGITRSKYKKWIGFSLDEWRRAQRLSAGKEGLRDLLRFPLISDIPIRRHEAILVVERMGWPTPPRSRCWMCPNQQTEEWRDLPREEFEAAVAFEAEIRAVDPHTWLHRSCKPLATVNLESEPGLFDGVEYCSSGSCFI